jgi:hypothetical protein
MFCLEMIIVTLSFRPIHHLTDAVQYFANFRGLKPTHFFILAVIFQYFQHATLIPTLEGSSVAHVEKHWCLLSKLL